MNTWILQAKEIETEKVEKKKEIKNNKSGISNEWW